MASPRRSRSRSPRPQGDHRHLRHGRPRHRQATTARCIEDTIDWFAQDRDGNVWYFGEDSQGLRERQGRQHRGFVGGGRRRRAARHRDAGRSRRSATCTARSTTAGEAEDMMEIAASTARPTRRAGAYRDVLVTDDWNPLEPEVVEQKSLRQGRRPDARREDRRRRGTVGARRVQGRTVSPAASAERQPTRSARGQDEVRRMQVPSARRSRDATEAEDRTGGGRRRRRRVGSRRRDRRRRRAATTRLRTRSRAPRSSRPAQPRSPRPAAVGHRDRGRRRRELLRGRGHPRRRHARSTCSSTSSSTSSTS